VATEAEHLYEKNIDLDYEFTNLKSQVLALEG
jgi:hypothetical protein